MQAMKPQILKGSPLAIALSLAIAFPVVAADETEGHVAAATAASANLAATDLDKVEVHGYRAGYNIEETRTATRTNTALINVPQSITVVTEDMIDDTAMRGLADVVQYVPGAGMAQGEGHRDAPVLRGNTSTADMFVDGMRDDVQYFRDLYNAERVEVLKGPNAMIFGRGGTGGVINRVTKQAEWAPVREASLQLGSWDRRRMTGDVGQAVNEAFAFRVTGLYEDSESFRDGFELKRWGINPSFAINAGENTQVRFDLEHFEDERVTDRGVPSYASPFNGRRLPVETARSTFFGSAANSPTTAEVDALTLMVEHDFGKAVLRNRTRYADYGKFYQNVFASGPARVSPSTGDFVVAIGGYSNDTQRENLFNQTDLTFDMQTGGVRHGFLAGLEFGRQETDNFRQTASFPSNVCYNSAGSFVKNDGSPNDTTSAFCVPLSNPGYNGPVTFAQSATDADNHSVAKVAAAYVQDQIEFSPKWQAVIGVRFDRFEVDFRNNRSGATISTTDNLWSPRTGLIFKPVEDLSLYASYGLTYQPRAGEQLSSLSATNAVFEPEEFKNYEIGAKWNVLPRLELSAAVFRLDHSNVVVAGSVAGESILVDGERIEGVEIGLAGNITDSWSVMGGYAWQDGEILAGPQSGHRPANLAEQTVSLWNRYNFNEQWGAGLGTIHRGEVFAQTGNAVTLKSFTRYDAALFYSPTDYLDLQLNIENVFDKKYFASAHNDNNITPGAPRGYYVTANFKF